MRILAIDPGSAKVASSTNGIVLLDNAKLVNHWVVPSAKVQDIRNWFEEVGRFLDVDVVVIEKFEARDNDKSKDNSVLENVALYCGSLKRAITRMYVQQQDSDCSML